MTRGRRFAAQLVLLPLLWLVQSLNPIGFTLVVAGSIVIVWPVSLAVAAILVWLARQAEQGPDAVSETLVEAADNAVTLALVSTGLAVAGVVSIARLVGFEIPGRPILILLGWALVLVGVPALSWLRTLRNVWLPMVRR
jgi:hypothetical protein